MLSDVALMGLNVAALYRHDERGRLLAENEPGDFPAPRLYVGLSGAGNLWRFRHDLPDSMVRDLDRLLRREPAAVDLARRPSCYDQLRAALETAVPIVHTWFGPVWRFPERIDAPADVVEITNANLALLRRMHPEVGDRLPPERRPCMAVIQKGGAVSVCSSSRSTPDASTAGVETLEAFRGRGYATAAVAAWALAIRASGRVPIYGTSWDNLASQAVARKLGLVPCGADLHFS
jgi:GNAT acetyltransferase